MLDTATQVTNISKDLAICLLQQLTPESCPGEGDMRGNARHRDRASAVLSRKVLWSACLQEAHWSHCMTSTLYTKAGSYMYMRVWLASVTQCVWIILCMRGYLWENEQFFMCFIYLYVSNMCNSVCVWCMTVLWKNNLSFQIKCIIKTCILKLMEKYQGNKYINKKILY